MIKQYYCLLTIFTSLLFSGMATAEEEIRIALRANKGAEIALKQWQATADYLTENIPGYRFTLTPFENNSSLNQAISRGEFHFCLTNPASAVEHKIRYNVQPLATLVNKRQGKGYSKFGSVIFTRADRHDINRLEDLKGKTFIGADELGFGGWRVAWRELLKNNINPYTDFRELGFAGGKQQNVVYAVIEGKKDAGSVRTDMLERMAAAGKIDLSELKPIGLKHSEDFPFLHSTELYPEWLFSAIRKMDDQLKTRVVATLFAIRQDTTAAINGKYIGWISPLDYTPVENLLKELGVGPYHMATMGSFERLVHQYGLVLLTVTVVIALLTLAILYMLRLNHRISTTQESLKNEVNTRERAESILASLAEQGLAFTREESFFNKCLINLAELFDVKYAFIGLFADTDKTRIKSYAAWDGTRFIEDFEYQLEGTPCLDVLDLKEDLISEHVREKYPYYISSKIMDIESYFGTPLVSPEGLPMGVVAVMDTKPMKPDTGLKPIIKIFANRIALELQRQDEAHELQGMARQLSYQASHDALTGLVNRREFELRMKNAWDSSTNNNEHHALCYLDLDQFKIINDTCGHMAGDELLKQLAIRLESEIRGSDTLARLGGDEFGILLLDCSMERAVEIAEKLLSGIKSFRFSWEDNVFEVGASIGLVPINAMSRDIYELLQAADSACYVAKDLGRNRIHLYKEDDIAIASHQGEMRWLSEISRALNENDFVLYRQTIQPLKDALQSSKHYELLIRMRNEKGETLLPGSFISAAERYNLMYPIDQWVIENAFSFINRHYSKEVRSSSEDMLYTINLSGLSIGNDNIYSYISSMIDRYDISPNTICFEITETAAITNFSQAIKFIERMKKKGFRFALDDFGTGLCSYAYLRNLPVDYLKIDGRFISGLIDDPMNRAIIESIVHIARVMKIYTIAEWVEDGKILDELRKMGVDYAQGYYIGLPEKAPDFIKNKGIGSKLD